MEPDTDNAISGENSAQEAEQESEGLGTQVDVKVLGACKRRIRATVPADVVQERLDQNYQELAGSVQLPGFRRGRVPRRLLEKRFGEDINSDVQQGLLQESFAEVIEKEELKVFGTPRFEESSFTPGEDFVYEVEVDVQPEFELPDYKGVEVEAELQPVEDSDVDDELEKMRKNRSRFVPIDASKAGAEDIFAGHYELYSDGARVKSKTEVSFSPQHGRIDVFEVERLDEQVQAWDRSSGEPLVLQVTVPQHFPDEVLRGKEVELRFYLNQTQTLELPPLDDGLADAMGYQSIEDLKADLRKTLESARKRERDRRIEDKIVQMLTEQVDIELPEDLVQNRQQALTAEQETEATEAVAEDGEGSTEKPDTQAKSIASHTEAPEDGGEDLKKELKEFFLLGRIGDKEKIFATEEEVNKRVAILATLNGIPPQTLREELSESGRLDEIRLGLRNEKVRAFLRKKAKVAGSEEPEESGEAAAPSTPEPAEETDSSS